MERVLLHNPGIIFVDHAHIVDELLMIEVHYTFDLVETQFQI